MPDSFNLFISLAPYVKFKVYDLQYYLLQCMKLGQHRTNLQLIPQIFLIIFKQSIFSLALKEWPSEQEGGIPDHTFAFVRSAKVACIDLASQQKQKRKTALLVR